MRPLDIGPMLDQEQIPSPQPQGPFPGRYRWIICALLFAATTINYMDRQILGILAPVLQKELGWTEIDYGNIIVSFQAAYALGLVVVGAFMDRFGVRLGYAVAIGLWSIAAMGHGLARSVTGFIAARFALGLGEAGNFPAAIKSIAEWFPRRERALATGIFNSGSNMALGLCAVCVVPVMFAAQTKDLWVAVGLVSLAASAHQGWSANLFTLASDMFPRRAVGSVIGIGGMAGAVGGILFSSAVGHILERTQGNYFPIFAVCGVAYLVALGIIHCLAPRLEPVAMR